MFGNGGKGRGIVSMTDREREKRLEPLRLVEHYWHELATARGEVPLRSEIDPRSIENALEYAFLAERIAPGLAKLRVAGAHLNDLMGMETAGMPLSTLFTPAARETLAGAVGRCSTKAPWSSCGSAAKKALVAIAWKAIFCFCRCAPTWAT